MMSDLISTCSNEWKIFTVNLSATTEKEDTVEAILDHDQNRALLPLDLVLVLDLDLVLVHGPDRVLDLVRVLGQDLALAHVNENDRVDSQPDLDLAGKKEEEVEWN